MLRAEKALGARLRFHLEWAPRVRSRQLGGIPLDPVVRDLIRDQSDVFGGNDLLCHAHDELRLSNRT